MAAATHKPPEACMAWVSAVTRPPPPRRGRRDPSSSRANETGPRFEAMTMCRFRRLTGRPLCGMDGSPSACWGMGARSLPAVRSGNASGRVRRDPEPIITDEAFTGDESEPRALLLEPVRGQSRAMGPSGLVGDRHPDPAVGPVPLRVDPDPGDLPAARRGADPDLPPGPGGDAAAAPRDAEGVGRAPHVHRLPGGGRGGPGLSDP